MAAAGNDRVDTNRSVPVASLYTSNLVDLQLRQRARKLERRGGANPAEPIPNLGRSAFDR
jgi:hypothetical protein